MATLIKNHPVSVRVIFGVTTLAIYVTLSSVPWFAVMTAAVIVAGPSWISVCVATAALIDLLVFNLFPEISVYPILATAIACAVVSVSRRDVLSATDDVSSLGCWSRWRRPIVFALGSFSLACAMFKALPLVEPIAWSFALILIGWSLPKSTHPRHILTRGNAILLASSVVLGFFVLEIGARLAFEPIVPARQLYVPHPKYNYTLGRDVNTYQRVALTEGEPFESDVVVSSQGIFAREIYGPKASDEFRIVMLGDSFTAGHGLAWKDTLGQALQSLLSEESLTKRVTVINCGVGAYGPWQERGFLQERGFPLEPDLVIHQLFTANDVHDTLMQYGKHTDAYPIWWHRRVDAFRRQSMLRYRAHDWLMRRSRVYQLLARDLPGATLPWLPNRFRYFAIDLPKYPPSEPRNWSMEVNLATWYPTLQEGWKLFKDDVLAIRKDCLDRGVGYVAYDIPYYVSLREDAWELNRPKGQPEGFHVKLKDVTESEAFFRRAGIPYVDVTTALARQPNQSDMFHHPDGHLKKGGSWIVAREIKQYLMTGYLPKIGLVKDAPPSNDSQD